MPYSTQVLDPLDHSRFFVVVRVTKTNRIGVEVPCTVPGHSGRLGHMDTTEKLEEAVAVLQQLGLKEYEARCFVGLIRLETGTAKKLSELTEVPRTRVYDAIRVLEAQGFVEIQHSSPQQFRAVPLDEATETLRDQYEARVERLQETLETVDTIDNQDESPVQEVWAMAGHDAIENRTNDLIEDASEEIVLVVGDESLLTEDLLDALEAASDNVEVIVGSLTESVQDRIRTAVPEATTFVSGLEWLGTETSVENDTAVGRLLLVDRSTILVSSIVPETKEERAIFGGGFGNGLVVIARRLMAQGLIPVRDPAN